MITPAEFEDRMREISTKVTDAFVDYHEEEAHIDADELMCNVLKDLGYTKGVEIFEQMPKWYS